MCYLSLTTLLPLVQLNMGTQETTFSQLQEGLSTTDIHARLLHFWEAKNPKRGNMLMGLELLFVDQTSTLMQAFLSAHRVSRFETQLKSQTLYCIRNVHAAPRKHTYRVADHKFMIQFTDDTLLQEIGEEGNNIPKEKFRFRTYEEFDSNAHLNIDLCDALGKVVYINDEQPNLYSTKGKLGIHLLLKSGPIFRVTLWTNIAEKFREILAKAATDHRVILATAINPRKLGGMLYLNSTSATRFYFDKDIDATNEYLTWIDENQTQGGVIDFPASEVIKLESVTLAELHKFLASKSPQRASFTCEATIANILPDCGWNYVACTKCTSKLSRTATTLVCNKCKDPNAVGIIRYRVELSVRDENQDVATFVMFDRESTQLVGKKATDIVDEPDGSSSGGDIRGVIPQCLLDTVGKTFNFQVKVTEYNFIASRQTITVSRILLSTRERPEPAPLSNKAVPNNEEKVASPNETIIGEGFQVAGEVGDDEKSKRARSGEEIESQIRLR